MIPCKVSELVEILDSKVFKIHEDTDISYVSIDSRKIHAFSQTLFVALQGSINNGHQFIAECIDKGVSTFLISDIKWLNKTDHNNYILVEDTIDALQKIASHNRSKTRIPIIGITGSNGKTTIKEWLSFLLSKKYKVVKSPGSYNSQIGVPLSVLLLNSKDEIGVFEAGISAKNEMQNLQKIIQPEIGIFSNIGEAHNKGFSNQSEKINEKLKLFLNARKIVICADHANIVDAAKKLKLDDRLITWGLNNEANLFRILNITTTKSQTKVEVLYKEKNYLFTLNLTDKGSFQNVFHCVAALLVIGYSMEECIDFVNEIFPLPMRLNLSKGRDESILINDAYNHDLTSLTNALEFLHQQKGKQPSLLILSDIEESQLSTMERIEAIDKLLTIYPVNQIWWVGNTSPKFAHQTFTNTADLLDFSTNANIANHYVLIKGARKHRLDEVKKVLEYKNHSARLEIDLASIDHNLQYYANLLHSETGIIAVLKAGAYGSGTEHLARLLQYRGVKYIAVAFVDEGIELRHQGIKIPILVLNPDQHSFHQLFKYNLEPEIYSLNQLKDYIEELKHNEKSLPIHLKLDSGMNRLGFKKPDLLEALLLISKHKIIVNTVFSHLAGSETPVEDEYSQQQYQTFIELVEIVKTNLNSNPKIHFVNTGGIVRFPKYHHDYVRLGLGLYGIDTTKQIASNLEKVHTFTATIIQTKWVESGEKIGYNQKGIAHQKMKIGIINAGYADGIPRNLGCGHYSFICQGKHTPILGNVCMDLTIIDLSQCPQVEEGESVEIFGENNPIEKLAETAGTIPYEILSRISTRVKKEWIYW